MLPSNTILPADLEVGTHSIDGDSSTGLAFDPDNDGTDEITFNTDGNIEAVGMGIGGTSATALGYFFASSGTADVTIDADAGGIDEAQLNLVSGTNSARAFFRSSGTVFGLYMGGTKLRITNANIMSLMESGGKVVIGANNVASAELDVGGGTATSIDGVDDLLVKDDVEIDGDLYVEGRTGNTLQITTLGSGVTTLAVTQNIVTLTGDAGSNTIATITGGVDGQLLTLIFVDGFVTITDDDAHGADSIDLSAAFTSADDTVLQLVYDGTSWYEVSRSVN